MKNKLYWNMPFRLFAILMTALPKLIRGNSIWYHIFQWLNTGLFVTYILDLSTCNTEFGVYNMYKIFSFSKFLTKKKKRWFWSNTKYIVIFCAIKVSLICISYGFCVLFRSLDKLFWKQLIKAHNKETVL